MVEQHWQKPSEHMVVLRGTGPMLNPIYWTPSRVMKLRAADPVAYRTDVLGEFADPESGLLDPGAVDRNTRKTPVELPYEHGATYHAAVDPSEGNARSNGFSLCIVERQEPGRQSTRYGYGYGEDWSRTDDDSPRFRVVLVREWRGFSPAQVWREIAKVCRSYGLRRGRTDQYSASASRDLAAFFGLHLDVRAATAASKLEDYTNLATLLHNDKIELPPDARLHGDLLSVKRRITQGAATIVLPRTGDGRHCDSASALVAALTDAQTCVAPRPFYVPGM
jgi:hypothetical protein